MRNLTIKYKVSKACSNPKFVEKVLADISVDLTPFASVLHKCFQLGLNDLPLEKASRGY